MALTSGTRIGPYEVGAPLGAGGMGEVYRARDTRLNRDVALKILSDRLAADPERLSRLRREAQLLASLNHPNIGAIHGFEDDGGVQALVLELIEGPTLADRIAQGAMALDEALPVARQIAAAVESAHEQGVIHRDLKPANIKIRPDGTVKVLDFGLAKAFEGNAATPDVSQSPTLSMGATHAGVILGTAAYMAPEQARGRVVDKRADIWAFGCVLFEMVTGRPVFDGEDLSEILASVIKSGPALERLPADIQPRLRHLIARCLEKDVRNRYRDMGDVRYDLERIEAEPTERQGEADRGVVTTRRRSASVALAAAVVLTALITGGAVWLFNRAAPPILQTVRFAYTLSQDQPFRSSGRPVVAIAPDGRHFVYNANTAGGGGGLFLRSMDSLDSRLIQGTQEAASNPFFSPDGQWVGFFSIATNQLKKVPIAGGTAVVVAAAANPFGVTWGADDRILFGQPEGILRVSANGGTPELLVAAKPGEEDIHGPQMLPGGEWLMFASANPKAGQLRWDSAQIVAQSLATGERKVLWKGGSDARYVPTGHLVYALGTTLFAVRFDLQRMEVLGGPVPLVATLMRSAGFQTGAAHYALSDLGSLVHVTGVDAGMQARTLVWVDRQGREEPIAAPARAYLAPRISPDGTRVALDVRDQESDIWIWNLAGQTLTRLTFDPGLDRYPVWTPDGARIVFSSQRAGGSNLFWQAADGTGAAEQLLRTPNIHYPMSVSPDGATVLLEQQAASGIDILMAPLAPDSQTKALVSTAFVERNAAFSADGKWMAYQSAESDRNEVFVRPFPATDSGRWQVSSGGGAQPVWSADGRELFFADADGRIMAAAIHPGPGFGAGTPQVVIDRVYSVILSGIAGRMYDVAPDGKRFLLLKAQATAAGTAPSAQIVVVQHWFEELKRLVPVN